jgi:hypothetical protein
MTPSIAIVHVDVQNPQRRRIRLWLPLFLLWIPLLLLSPLILIVIIGLSLAGGIDPWQAVKTFWGILCSLQGTEVRVNADGNKVYVRIL